MVSPLPKGGEIVLINKCYPSSFFGDNCARHSEIADALRGVKDADFWVKFQKFSGRHPVEFFLIVHTCKFIDYETVAKVIVYSLNCK